MLRGRGKQMSCIWSVVAKNSLFLSVSHAEVMWLAKGEGRSYQNLHKCWETGPSGWKLGRTG